MSNVIASSTLINGLFTDFKDTYQNVRKLQSDSRLGNVMGNLTADNYYRQDAYFNASPHIERWDRGNTIPQDAFDSTNWKNYVYTYGKRIKWFNEDREDDQIGGLYPMAQETGRTAALLPERFFFEQVTATADLLPAIANAPDGVGMFSATDGDSADRFSYSGGNIISGSGVTTLSSILTDYYAAIVRFGFFQDGQGQPLLSNEVIAGGALVIHSISETQVMEQAFAQIRQGVGITALGVPGTASVVAAHTPTNIIHDASRNVELWGTPRLATGDWYIFLKNSPQKPSHLIDRRGVQEFSSLRPDNNSDHVRDTGEEYVQWDLRQGAMLALPFGAIKVNN